MQAPKWFQILCKFHAYIIAYVLVPTWFVLGILILLRILGSMLNYDVYEWFNRFDFALSICCGIWFALLLTSGLIVWVDGMVDEAIAKYNDDDLNHFIDMDD